MLILSALAGRGQQLMPLDLPYDGQHIDGPPVCADDRRPQILDRLDVSLVGQLVLFFVHRCSLLLCVVCAKEGIFISKAFALLFVGRPFRHFAINYRKGKVWQAENRSR